MRNRALRAVAVLTGLSLIAATPGGGLFCLPASAATPEFVHPVNGPIVRPFVAPLGPYASGHRGIDYGVPAGTPVVASGKGVVSFAGPVADDGLFITIRHGEVIQTTYSFLSQVVVEEGQEVSQGDVIGVSGEGHPGEGVPVLHFGAKAGGQYIDPEILLFGNLDDISGLISLAPFDDQDDFTKASGTSTALRPIEPRTAPEARDGFFAGLGHRIADAAKSVVAAPGRALGWIGGKIAGLAELGRRVWRGVSDGLGAAYERTMTFAGKLAALGSKLLQKMGALGSNLVEKIRALGSNLVQKIGRALSRAAPWRRDSFRRCATGQERL